MTSKDRKIYDKTYRESHREARRSSDKARLQTPEYKEYQRAYRESHKEDRKIYRETHQSERSAYMKRYNKARLQTPEYKDYQRVYMKARLQTPERQAYSISRQNTTEYKAGMKAYYLKTKYNLTVSEYNNLCDNGCQNCGSHTRLHVDHKHGTNQARGILCQNCNVSLGLVNENPETMFGLSQYILKAGWLC